MGRRLWRARRGRVKFLDSPPIRHADSAGMKRLYFLRHAKAVPADPGLDDFARELTVRGMHDAAAIARYLRKNDMAPELIWASAAARARQTAELVLREVQAKAEYRQTLYLAEPGKMLAMIH